MAIVGYARVSTKGQSYASQVDRLTAAGCEKMFVEKASGTDGARPELARCVDYLREGDTLLVTKVDRLARSTSDLYATIGKLNAKGVGFKAIDDVEMDTTSRTGKLLLGILSIIAEFETDIRKERQMEGIARAKEAGVKSGRPPILSDALRGRILAMREEGLSIRAIAAQVSLSKATVQKVSAPQRQSAPVAAE